MEDQIIIGSFIVAVAVICFFLGWMIGSLIRRSQNGEEQPEESEEEIPKKVMEQMKQPSKKLVKFVAGLENYEPKPEIEPEQPEMLKFAS